MAGLRDPRYTLVDLTEATVTPEVVLFDEAIRHYERALRFLPDSPDLLYNLEQAQQIKAELER